MNPIIPFPSLYLPGIHGLAHAYRVLRLVQRISEAEKASPAQRRILAFCAVFHDIGRVNDGKDPGHGFRSITKLRDNGFFGLREFDTPLVHYIIENHCITDSSAFENVAKYAVAERDVAVLLLKMFKDADNLDRVRLGDFDGRYLRCAASRGLVEMAVNLFQEAVGEEEAVGVFEVILFK